MYNKQLRAHQAYPIIRRYPHMGQLDGLGDASTAARVTGLTSEFTGMAAQALAPFPPASAIVGAVSAILGFVSRGQGRLAEFSQKRNELNSLRPRIQQADRGLTGLISKMHGLKNELNTKLTSLGVNPASVVAYPTPVVKSLSGYYPGLSGYGMDGYGMDGVDGFWDSITQPFRAVANFFSKPAVATAKYVSDFKKNITYDLDKLGQDFKDVFTPGAEEKKRYEREAREVEAMAEVVREKDQYRLALTHAMNHVAPIIDTLEDRKKAQMLEQQRQQAIQMQQQQLRAAQAQQQQQAAQKKVKEKETTDTLLLVGGGLALAGLAFVLTSKSNSKKPMSGISKSKSKSKSKKKKK